MKYSLRTKLTLSYILIAFLLVAAISFMANYFLEKQFVNYITKEQEQRNTEIVNLISKQIRNNGSVIDKDVIGNIGINALEQGLILKVRDPAGKTIWDATIHNNGLCTQMISHMAHNMSSRYPNFNGKYVVNEYKMTRNEAEIGSVEIGYYGPFYFRDNDLAFINALNKMLIGVGIFALLVAIGLGAYMAKRLSLPISSAIASAQQISRGYYNDRISDESKTKEIGLLTSTINNLAETLEKQEILRKRLTADVAHELRTPLSTLQSHLEAMIDGIWKADADRLKSCHDEVLRINRMVGDLQQLAKYESENLVLNKTSFDLSELLFRIIQNFQTDFTNKGIEIKYNGGVGKIVADKDKISQVIINLLSNALKYTKEGGYVIIQASESGDDFDIKVKDTGIGISPEDLPYIFERFYRADKSRNRMTGGSGIGLAIVKAIVEAHRGTISAQSEIETGTEFTIKIPKDKQ